jgi:pyrroline-5-carboxylate reductase
MQINPGDPRSKSIHLIREYPFIFIKTSVMKKIAIIGGGNLGTAIAEGLLKSKFSKAPDITVTRRNTAINPLKPLGIDIISDNNAAARRSDVVILAVKPFQTIELLKDYQKGSFPRKNSHLRCYGVTLHEIEAAIDKKLSLFRAMPNTAISIQQSMTCLCHQHAKDGGCKICRRTFQQIGKVVFIDEKLMEAATILGACGTAYAMRYIRANIQGGIEIGFDAATASLIAAQTVMGAAELLLLKKSHPEQEIDKVTTPKGCTIAGLNEMEHRGFSSSLIRGIVASYQKIAKD